MDEREEKRLVAGLRAGDLKSFRRVYDLYRPRLFGYLFRLSADRSGAEDLLQETWLRLARSSHSLAEDSRLGPWLYTVARNVFLSQIRKDDAENRKRAGVKELNQVEAESVDSKSHGSGVPSGAFEQLAAQETGQLLERALERLPLDMREALLLVGVEQLEQETAAQVMGIKPATFRKRLSRGRARLAQEFEALQKAEERT